MNVKRHRGLGLLVCALSVVGASSAWADEIWVAPTYQADIGGIGVGTSVFWPATPLGAVRFAFGIPDNLDTFTSAKLVLIPEAPGGATTLGVFVCAAEDTDPGVRARALATIAAIESARGSPRD